MKKSDVQKFNIYKSLLVLCPIVESPPPQYDEWPKTREIAEGCDISIYSARIYLLELEKDGKVLCSHKSINNSLRWYPCFKNEEYIRKR
jgi:hypothetical protein